MPPDVSFIDVEQSSSRNIIKALFLWPLLKCPLHVPYIPFHSMSVGASGSLVAPPATKKGARQIDTLCLQSKSSPDLGGPEAFGGLIL